MERIKMSVYAMHEANKKRMKKQSGKLLKILLFQPTFQLFAVR